MGLCYNIAFVFSYEKIYPERTHIEVEGKIVQNKEEKEYCNKYIVKIRNTKVILYTKKGEEFLAGDIVFIKGEFEKGEIARNYKGFNYRNYLKQKRIYGIINAENVEKINHKRDLNSIIEAIKYNLYNKIDYLYNKKNADFLKGILLGNTEGLDDDIKENFRNSSISHILAISGMHVTYVVIGIKYFLDKLYISKRNQNYILIIFLMFFIAITGFSVSCIRACIMSTITLMSFNVERKSNFYRSLLVAFIIIILINPFNIFSVGMWLSFLSTLSIVLFNSFFLRVFKKIFRKKQVSFIYKTMIISISAQVLMLPVMIYFFNTISLTFLIPNVLVSFVIAPVLMFGYLSILTSFIFMPLAKALASIESFWVSTILKISEICAKVPFSKIYACTPSIISILIYYCLVFYIVRYFKNNKFSVMKLIIIGKIYIDDLIKTIKNFVRRKNINKKTLNMKNNYKFYKKERIAKKLLTESKLSFTRKIAVILLIIAILSNNINSLDLRLKIYFVDVAQGDCTVIVTPKGKNIIIDGGEGNSKKYDYGKSVVMPYLLDRHIKKIDYLIVSHRR